MFPFTVRGKVHLGLRKDFHLSTASLEERIAERLMEPSRLAKLRREKDPVSESLGPLKGSVSRLLSLGFLSTAKVRKINIISIDESLIATYEMDAAATALICVVLIPLVLGPALVAHAKLTLLQALGILFLLVLTSWGMDIWGVVQLVRHEIKQTASEIKGVILLVDNPEVDAHHRDLDPEDLLASAYYYQRNGLTKRSRSYFTHLAETHPGTLEATLARENLGEDLYVIPIPPLRDGEKKQRRKIRPWRRKIKDQPVQRDTYADGRQPAVQTETEGAVDGRGKSGLRRLFRFRKRAGSEAAGERRDRKTQILSGEEKGHRSGEDGFSRRGGLLRFFRRHTREERAARKRQERWIHGPRRKVTAGDGNDGHSGRKWWSMLRLRSDKDRLARRQKDPSTRRGGGQYAAEQAETERRRWRILRRESREDRLARKRMERWSRPDAAREAKEQAEDNRRRWRLLRWESKEDRLARKRMERWSHGPSSNRGNRQNPAQGNRLWRRLRGEPKKDRLMRERRERAAGG
ncbi:MAG: hypothetical protein JSV26_10680 [bacterium]|nr:MAG: hypothetical protein JSV26_10680 [bacterium]